MNGYEINRDVMDPLSEEDRKEMDIALNAYLDMLEGQAKLTDGYSDEYYTILNHWNHACKAWGENHRILMKYKQYHEKEGK